MVDCGKRGMLDIPHVYIQDSIFSHPFLFSYIFLVNL